MPSNKRTIILVLLIAKIAFSTPISTGEVEYGLITDYSEGTDSVDFFVNAQSSARWDENHSLTSSYYEANLLNVPEQPDTIDFSVIVFWSLVDMGQATSFL